MGFDEWFAHNYGPKPHESEGDEALERRVAVGRDAEDKLEDRRRWAQLQRVLRRAWDQVGMESVGGGRRPSIEQQRAYGRKEES